MQTPRDFAESIESEAVSFDLGGGYHWDNAKVEKRIAARDAEWQARVDRLEAALKECSGIRSMVESIERGESYEGGEPDIGTCRLLGNIKRISDKARAALAESEAVHE